MRVWIDLANSPHVPLLEPVVARLRADGHTVVLTARDHAQTVELARRAWPDVLVIGGPSPSGRAAKARVLAQRVAALRSYARRQNLDVAFSHGSYAQIVAARLARVPAVTMMDYEHQPANHLSFRLAQRVIVPEAFPAAALRGDSARAGKGRSLPRIQGRALPGVVPAEPGRARRARPRPQSRARRLPASSGRCALSPWIERPLRRGAQRGARP